MTKMHWMDETLFLIERYGHARREGTHLDKSPSEWMDLIHAKLYVVSQTLDDLQTVYRHDRHELDRLQRCNCGALSAIDHLRTCPRYSRP